MSGDESAANTPGCEVRSLSSGLKFPYKRTISAPVGMGLSPVSKANLKLTNSSASSSAHQSAYQRQQSLPTQRGKLHHSKSPHELHKQVSSVGSAGPGALSSGSGGGGGGVPGGGDECEYANVAAKTLDMDEIDKESLHLLVFLFMQFLSHPEMAKVPDGHGGHGHGSGHGSRQGGDHGEREHKEHHKTTQAARNVQAAAMNRCFQCLYSLLGYNEVERRFQVMPSKIRSTPTVNAFLASLPQMLDYNFALGETLLLNTILVLQKLPFPPRYASSWQQSHTLMQESHLFQGCGFSLWYLEPSLRKNWLLATVVIFYKYNINADSLTADKAIGLVRIVLHTLAAHVHTCDRFSRFNGGGGGGAFPPGYAGLVGGVSARSRDLSQLSSASIGETEKGDEDYEDDEDDGDEEGEEDGGEGAAIRVSGAGSTADIQEEVCGQREKNKPNGPPRKTEPVPPSSPPLEEGTRTVTTEAQVEPERDSDVRIPMAGLFGFLPKPASAMDSDLNEVDAPTPDHYHLTSEGLPSGWAMQLMRNGRTLFIDNSNQVGTRTG